MIDGASQCHPVVENPLFRKSRKRTSVMWFFPSQVNVRLERQGLPERSSKRSRFIAYFVVARVFLASPIL